MPARPRSGCRAACWQCPPSSRGLDKALISTLSNCSWITRKQNLMILGPTGVGKTWLASAFGHQACRLGMTVAFYVANDWSRHLQGQRKHTNADPQRHT